MKKIPRKNPRTIGGTMKLWGKEYDYWVSRDGKLQITPKMPDPIDQFLSAGPFVVDYLQEMSK